MILEIDCSRGEIQRIDRLYRNGYSAKEIGDLLQRNPARIRRYIRLFESFGLDAFPRTTKKMRSINIKGANSGTLSGKRAIAAIRNKIEQIGIMYGRDRPVFASRAPSERVRAEDSATIEAGGQASGARKGSSAPAKNGRGASKKQVGAAQA